MAQVTQVGTGGVGGTNPTTTTTLTFSSQVLAGDECFLAVTSRDHTVGTAYPTVTDNDTGGNTWTRIAESTDRKATLWYKRATSGTASKTITISGAVGSLTANLRQFRGADPANPYKNLTVETNASGGEDHAGFTADAEAAIVLFVFNYANDNAISSVDTANFGAMGSELNHLSTGGSDCATGSAVDDSVAGGATGLFSWSQTNGTTYSMVFQVPPPPGPQSITNPAVLGTASLLAPTVAISGSGDILMVVGDAASLTANDTTTKSRLEGLGYTVTLRSDDDDASTATNYDAVVICESSSGGTVAAKYKDSAVPILVGEYAVWDDMSLCASTAATGVSLTQYQITTNAHPVRGSVASGTQTVHTAGGDMASAVESGASAPASGAVRVASTSASLLNWSVFSLDSGATRSDSTASPDKRVAMSMISVGVWNATAWELFDNAMLWLAPVSAVTEVEPALLGTASLLSPTVNPGAVSVTATLLGTAAILSPTVAPGVILVVPARLGVATLSSLTVINRQLVSTTLLGTAALHGPTVAPGPVSVATALLGVATLHSPSVATGATLVVPDRLGVASLLSPQVVPGAAPVVPGLLGLATLLSPSLRMAISVDRLGVATLHAPSVSIGASFVSVGVLGTATLLSPTLTLAPYLVTIPRLGGASVLSPSAIPGVVFAYPDMLGVATLPDPFIAGALSFIGGVSTSHVLLGKVSVDHNA